MRTYLFTWNPSKWDWKNFSEDYAACRQSQALEASWSCGVTRRISRGDRVFLVALGSAKNKGLMGSGFVTSETVWEGKHHSDSRRTALYVDLEFDVLLDPSIEKLISLKTLEKFGSFRWTPQASGVEVPAKLAAAVEELWSAHVSAAGFSIIRLPEEGANDDSFPEGALRAIFVNAYERNPRARQKCIEHHGLVCASCRFDFEAEFGDIGKNFIHVHHLRPLSSLGKTYQVDPVKDLVPVCPNCHAMLHRREPPLNLKELAEHRRQTRRR